MSPRLTKEQIFEIRRLYCDGWLCRKELAAVFNISYATIGRVLRKMKADPKQFQPKLPD